MSSSTPSESSTPKLTLICPTIGRSSLARVVESVVGQMQDGDEFIVVGDGPLPGLAETLDPRVIYFELPVRIGDSGCTPCDAAIERATGDVVFFIGDDDVCAPGAFEVIRAAVALAPDVPHVFSMMHTGRKLGGTIGCCAVSGQQIVVPRDMTRMPKMSEVSAQQMGVSDWVFIDKVHRAWDGRTVFHDEVIAILPQQNCGRMF